MEMVTIDHGRKNRSSFANIGKFFSKLSNETLQEELMIHFSTQLFYIVFLDPCSMTQFISFEDGIEVNGRTINSVLDGMGAYNRMGTRILEEAGIVEFSTDGNSWYPQQNWLNAFKQIAEKIGPITLKRIGQSIPENAEFPPDVDNIQKGLASIDVAYHMNHRNKKGEVLFNPQRNPPLLNGIGNYGIEESGDSRVVLKCHNPYPCSFDMGIITAMAKEFEITSTIKHLPGACRNEGDESCRYEVVW